MTSAYKNSPKWVKRIGEFFHQSDLNKDGFLSIEDFDIWIENIEKETKADAALMDKARIATREYWESVGLKPGVKLTKEQFLDKMAEFILKERTEYEKGNRDCLSIRYPNALFDAVDTNHNGFLELDEYENLARASYHDKDVAKVVFDMIDTNHDGKLSREELIDYNIKFWYYPDNKEVAGMYGSRYE